ncbi:hypothetical protein [Acutalibacter intestini]|uniref:hypothetical protein n=1 Tax=Acutalibacter intestini TaxID=3093659 RepID=UPI002AC8955E|nr:hypothetical protein [Acutalibacter sp. M00204]
MWKILFLIFKPALNGAKENIEKSASIHYLPWMEALCGAPHSAFLNDGALGRSAPEKE